MNDFYVHAILRKTFHGIIVKEKTILGWDPNEYELEWRGVKATITHSPYTALNTTMEVYFTNLAIGAFTTAFKLEAMRMCDDLNIKESVVVEIMEFLPFLEITNLTRSFSKYTSTSLPEPMIKLSNAGVNPSDDESLTIPVSFLNILGRPGIVVSEILMAATKTFKNVNTN